MGTINSKSKVAFCATSIEAIQTAKKSLNIALESLNICANKAKYAAVDRVYNTFAQLSTDFSVVLKDNVKVLTEIMAELVKHTDVGEAYVANAKKVYAECESVNITTDYEKITDERDGSEIWDLSTQGATQEALSKWILARLAFIENIADGFKKIEDEDFKEAVKPIGKKNEEFTNSLVSALSKMQDAIAELNLDINNGIKAIGSSASSLKAEAATVAPDLKGAAY